ncbi:uncharacterized protein KY384_002159 [Bacidia gigantensis]|uniref:uncharacterized protein n=1 Tax=Bacidia gigantensis TaxID=2732470 RepID=UPI001D04A280|nr:uncharacterized protein KY384_002159 [Bacidia gigantensis]KAG8533376.1 hypothetical protein KY384_002159 [Bacidia gigantensis]
MVRQAYAAFFDDLRIPWLTADASSGAMGGTLSHEYHVPSKKGEDRVFTCDGSCGYSANEELAVRGDDGLGNTISLPYTSMSELLSFPSCQDSGLRRDFYMTSDKQKLIVVITPFRSGQESSSINLHQLKRIPQLDKLDAGVENALDSFRNQLLMLQSNGNMGQNLNVTFILDKMIRYDSSESEFVSINGMQISATVEKSTLDLVRIDNGDKCPTEHCEYGRLQVQDCIELGHTFFLGTRYSSTLDATVSLPNAGLRQPSSQVEASEVPLQMGCHGIGISRIVASAADVFKDEKGLNWPRKMAPFEVVIIAERSWKEQAREVYDALQQSESSIDCVIDDRDASPGSKMKDAELIGYPVIVRIGQSWLDTPKKCLVRCRRPTTFDEDVPVASLKSTVLQLLETL